MHSMHTNMTISVLSTVVISSEMFSSMQAKLMASLAHLLPSLETSSLQYQCTIGVMY